MEKQGRMCGTAALGCAVRLMRFRLSNADLSSLARHSRKKAQNAQIKMVSVKPVVV